MLTTCNTSFKHTSLLLCHMNLCFAICITALPYESLDLHLAISIRLFPHTILISRTWHKCQVFQPCPARQQCKHCCLFPFLQYSQNISLLYYIRKLCISWTNVFVSGKDKCICRELGQMQLQHWLCSPVWMDGQIDRLGKVKLGNKCNATHWKNTNDLDSYKGLDAGLERNEDNIKSKG